MRNLTTTRYDVEIPAGASQTLPYSFTTDMNPQSLRLSLVAAVVSKTGGVYQIQAFNENVSVVEAAFSFLDPQVYEISLLPSPNSVTNSQPVCSFTSSSQPASVERSTLSTRPGSKLSSHKPSVEEKVVSALSVLREARRPLLRLRIRSLSLELMDLR